MKQSCPGCEKILDIPDSLLGTRGKCAACGAQFVASNSHNTPTIPMYPYRARARFRVRRSAVALAALLAGAVFFSVGLFYGGSGPKATPTPEDYEAARWMLQGFAQRFPNDPIPETTAAFFEEHGLVPDGEPADMPHLLSIATVNNWYPMAEFLLDRGWDPNEHREETTPLHYAANTDDARLIHMLIDRGAVVNPPWYAETPLDWAANNGCDRAVEALVSRGGKIHRDTMWAVSRFRPGTALRLQDNPDIFID